MNKTKVLNKQSEQIMILLAALLVMLAIAVRAEAYPTYGMPGDRPDFEPEWVYAGDEYADDLDGYGEWRFVSSVGGRLWFPFVDVSWRPYMYGHWINTDYGMTWVAYEPWGYLPHHYGRWIWVERYGWGWVPGREYGPAWVTWGVADDYIGWAPLAPLWYRYPHRHSYHVRHHPVAYGHTGFFSYDVSGIAFDLWVFVPDRHFYGVGIASHALPADRCVEFFRTERVLPVGHHIHLDYVRKKTPRRIETVAIDRVIETRGGLKFERPVPRGQENLIREAGPAVSRVVKRRNVESRPAEARTVTTSRTVTGKSDPVVRTRTITKSAETPKQSERDAARTRSSSSSRYEKSSSPAKPTAVVERKVTTERKATVERKKTETKRTAGEAAKNTDRKVSSAKTRAAEKDANKDGRGSSRSSGSTNSATKSRKR